MKYFHRSVLIKEVIKFLNVKKGHLYIDATAGGGGHTREILAKGGKVLTIDRDPESIEYLNKIEEKNLTVASGNFSHINNIANNFGFNKVSGILFDLGLSSNQLESSKRGFSFQKEGPLDMRTDPNLNITAKDIINNFENRRLNEIFQKFSQEKFSRSIADDICSARQVKEINTTYGLAQIIREVYRTKKYKSKIDPATKVFQALRIVVNSELINLEEALSEIDKLIEINGRLVIISFHSLEDSIVKRFFKDNKNFKVLTKSPIGSSKEEIVINPRSKSAKLRAAEKT